MNRLTGLTAVAGDAAMYVPGGFTLLSALG